MVVLVGMVEEDETEVAPSVLQVAAHLFQRKSGQFGRALVAMTFQVEIPDATALVGVELFDGLFELYQ
jgi:hypothetical protein